MATLRDLLQKNPQYQSDQVRIESHGLVNPPRAAALALSSPNAIGDLIGQQVAGALKGTANRPSDTIFKGNAFFQKPISLGKSQQGVRDAIDEKTPYFVKQSPAPGSILAKLSQEASSPAQLATNAAVGALNTFGSKKALKKLANKLKNRNTDASDVYATKYMTTPNGKVSSFNKKFSIYYPEYTLDDNGKPTYDNNLIAYSLSPRDVNQGKSWDDSNLDILDTTSFEDKKALAKWEKENNLQNQIIVSFKEYGKSKIIPFAGVISGLSEDIQPEWNSFRYVGSPFKVYRNLGVERSLKFELKTYYTTDSQKTAMIAKLQLLRGMAFPDTNISTITYSNDNFQYAFAPTLVEVSIGSLYNYTLSYIENLSFSIDENAPWPNTDVNMQGIADRLYPSVVNISIGLKIIENHNIMDNDKTHTKTFKYDFDGWETKVISKDDEALKQVADYNKNNSNTTNTNTANPNTTNTDNYA